MSLTPVYIPTHGTLADRVMEWFRANPDEELTREDVALKFEVPQSRVPEELALSVQQGRLQWMSGHPHGFYRLGGDVTTTAAVGAPPPATAVAASDLMFSISCDRCIEVSFYVPGLIDPRKVLAAMLEAAATTIGKQP